MALLDVKNLTKQFGGLTAVNNLDFSIGPGEIVSIIGPNGAGKTTIFNLITGFHRPTSGTIVFEGRSLVGLAPHQIALRGIGRTFQIVKQLAGMTVLENVMVGALAHTNDMGEARREAASILEFVGLGARTEQYARSLTLGGRKRLEIARALATRPRLILVAEVVAGLNPTETADTIRLIQRLTERGQFELPGVEALLCELRILVPRLGQDMHLAHVGDAAESKKPAFGVEHLVDFFARSV